MSTTQTPPPLPYGHDAMHDWFSLTYADYLVLPRSVLQSLPDHLQGQLADALRAIDAWAWPATVPHTGHYEVQLRDEETGRFIHDPYRGYQRGRRYVSRDELLVRCGKLEALP